MPAHRVQRVLDAIAPLVSLDARVPGRDNEAGDSLGALLADDAQPVADVAERVTYRSVVDRMLRALDDREQRIITMRFGLDGHAPAASGVIAATMHLSTERVRQIEARALSKLRHPSVEPEARELVAG